MIRVYIHTTSKSRISSRFFLLCVLQDEGDVELRRVGVEGLRSGTQARGRTGKRECSRNRFSFCLSSRMLASWLGVENTWAMYVCSTTPAGSPERPPPPFCL